MNKFLFLFKDAEHLKTLSPQQMQNYLQKWLDWTKTLLVKEMFITGEPIESSGKEIAGKNKTVSSTSENTMEKIITGFYLIKATGIKEAVEVAKSCPIYDVDGSLEIRLVRTIDL